MDKKAPIGVFDSGVGGISVLRELIKIMPKEDYLYLGDSIHAPYGTKTLEEARALTIENVNTLLDQGAKSIVIACNTATSAAARVLRSMYPEIPLVGIEPAIKPAVLDKPGSRIIVMATPMTLGQEKFRTLLARYENQAEIVPLPCPGLMEFVERGDLQSEELRTYLKDLLHTVSEKSIDSIVLGCTHYPFIKEMILEITEHTVKIFDGGNGTAREMKRRLEEKGLLTDQTKAGNVIFCNSRDTKEERELCEYLLHVS